MSEEVILDSSTVGTLSNPSQTGDPAKCNEWLEALLASGRRVILPGIAEFEVRRELIRAKKTKSLRRLDKLIASLEFIPMTQEALDQAAILWAEARNKGRPGAGSKSLDGDVILVAQVQPLDLIDPIIATSNPRHFALFMHADLWQNIT